MAETTYRKHPQSAGRVLDGVAFVVTADDNKMHTLNATGSILWTMAAEGIRVDTAAAELVRLYEVELPQATADVEECLKSFVERGIFICTE